MTNLEDLRGKTISSVEVIEAEYGRTYDRYICLTFTNGDKGILYGGIPYKPKPALDEMKKAPFFFSPEDIANRVLAEEREARVRKQNQKESDLAELKRLKKHLGLE